MKRSLSTIIAIFNQAGGVAKTSLTRDLGYELAINGRRVLLLDADPQGTLGMFLGQFPAERPNEETFWEAVCKDNYEDLLPHIVRTDYKLDIGLANRSLTKFELELMNQQDSARLMSILDRIKVSYDYIVIDCPPKISEISIQILLAADTLIIPVQTETKAVANFTEVQLEIVKTNRRRKNLKRFQIEVLGVAPTLYDSRYKMHRDHLDALVTSICPSFGYSVFPPIRRYVSVAEAGMTAQPLKLYDPNCPANMDIETIAYSLLKRKNAYKAQI